MVETVGGFSTDGKRGVWIGVVECISGLKSEILRGWRVEERRRDPAPRRRREGRWR